MEIKISAFIFILLYTVNCKPADPSDFEDGVDYDIQNNNNYEPDYDDPEDPEESRTVEEENPLKILTPSQEFIRNLSETVVLPCEISGGNFVRIWRKKKMIEENLGKTDPVLFQASIGMGAAPNMKQLANGSLEISNLHVQDAGEYECTALDTKNNSPKIEHKVILKLPPQIEFLSAKDNKTILRSGQTLILTCKASGYPKPVISWHKGSTRLDVEGEILEFTNVKHHHAGKYKCLADNKIGEPAFSCIDIKVEYKPVITVDKLIVSSENHSETELQCLVHAEPTPTVVWIKNGLTVSNTKRIQLNNMGRKHNLILKSIEDSDFGEYTCSATNAVGSSKKNIKLVKTPAILEFMKSNGASKELVLIWQVQSRSNLSANDFLYRKRGEDDWKSVIPEVKFSGNDLYEVRYIFEEDPGVGEYETKFRSQNSNGWSEFSEVKTFSVGDNTKQGHQKSHKKGHNKHMKDKQMTPTPTMSPQLEHTEHQGNENQSDFIKDRSTSVPGAAACLPIMSRVLLLTLALLLFLRNHVESPRT